MKYEKAGQEIGALVDNKQQQYGDMISAMGPFELWLARRLA